tara:strand:- start:253 stop:387 length:135 start_codon:yes stop_codon:yes gene_type:complete
MPRLGIAIAIAASTIQSAAVAVKSFWQNKIDTWETQANTWDQSN